MSIFKNTYFKQTLAVAAVSLSTLFCMGAATAQSALDDVLKAKEIKIGVPTDFPPYGFVYRSKIRCQSGVGCCDQC